MDRIPSGPHDSDNGNVLDRSDGSSLLDQIDPVALMETSLSKMHHQQATSQWIRTWSFAVTGFLGYAFFSLDSLVALIGTFFGIELLIYIVLLKDVEWHQSFWRYRDRVRACEEYLSGEIDKGTFCERYREARDYSREMLLWKDAFSPKKLMRIKTDFVESYLMIGILVVFIVRLVMIW